MEQKGTNTYWILQKPETRHVLIGFVDRLFIIVITFGTVATFFSVLRMVRGGWNLDILQDIITFTAAVVLLALRRVIRLEALLILLFGIIALSSFFNMLTVGLGGIGKMTFLASCILVGVFFGFRTGSIWLGFSVIAFGFVGFMVCDGIIPLLPDMPSRMKSPITWITQIAGFVVYTITIMVSIDGLQSELYKSVSSLEVSSVAYAESERKYRYLAENMSDMLVVQGNDRRVTYASPSTQKAFGYTMEEITNFSMDHYLTPRSLAAVSGVYQKLLPQAMKGPVAVPLMELEYVRKDGSTFWGEIRPNYIYDQDGHLTGSQSIIRDITERKKAEQENDQLKEQLRQADKLRLIGQLAGGIAHDFNNQLTGIMGYSELIQQDSDDGSKVRKYSDLILRISERAADLTAKLLAFARKGKYRTEIVNMHDMISETVAILERSINRLIVINKDLKALKFNVMGDPTLLQNAVLNLALNARDAMAEGGILTISTSTQAVLDPGVLREDLYTAPGPYLKISVMDTGIGMPDEIKSRLFEPFFTTKPVDKGTGMGLPAVFGTVSLHHGAISVWSEKDKGSIFNIWLPLAGNVETEQKKASLGITGNSKAHILMVEDEEFVAHPLQEILTRLGYSVTVCFNGKEAVEQYRKNWHSIDLVLLDLVLPYIDGREVFSYIHSVNPDARVIIFTGYDIPDSISGLLKEGALAVVRKPVNPDELVEIIKKSL